MFFVIQVLQCPFSLFRGIFTWSECYSPLVLRLHHTLYWVSSFQQMFTSPHPPSWLLAGAENEYQGGRRVCHFVQSMHKDVATLGKVSSSPGPAWREQFSLMKHKLAGFLSLFTDTGSRQHSSVSFHKVLRTAVWPGSWYLIKNLETSTNETPPPSRPVSTAGQFMCQHTVERTCESGSGVLITSLLRTQICIQP